MARVQNCAYFHPYGSRMPETAKYNMINIMHLCGPDGREFLPFVRRPAPRSALDCNKYPCAPGHQCNFGNYSLWGCATCGDHEQSTDGIECNRCPRNRQARWSLPSLPSFLSARNINVASSLRR